MIAKLKDYVPESIDFVLTDKVKEMFPPVLFEGATDVEKVIQTFDERFTATFPQNEVATRKMDKHEVDEIREEYCLLQEKEMPKRIENLAFAIAEAKRLKQEAEDALESVRHMIADYASMVELGTKEYKLSSTNTVMFALNGYYLYYSWIDGQMKLVKAFPIPEYDRSSLWSQESNNRQAMKDIFGLDFPEVKREVSQEDDELPFGDEDEE